MRISVPLRHLQAVLSGLVWVFLGLIVWVALLDLPDSIPGTGLDDSWTRALGHFLKNRFQAGEDYVFTYGPLSCFLTRAYDQDLYWYKLGWEWGMKLIFVLTLARLLAALSSRPARLTACAVAVVFAGPILSMPDVLYLLLILAWTILLVQSSGERWSARIVLTSILLAILALTKFTFLLLIVGSLALVALHMVAAGRLRDCSLLMGGFGASFLALWLALGQHLRHLPRFFLGSLEIAAGYQQAMAVAGEAGEIYLAGAIVVLLAATLIGFPLSRHWTGKALTLVLLIILTGFIQWKNSFIRHDQHAFGFFAFAVFLPWLVPAVFSSFDWRAPARVICLAYAVLLSGAGMELVLKNQSLAGSVYPMELLTSATRHWRTNLSRALRPIHVRDRLATRQESVVAAVALPRIKAVVGTASVDMLSYQQGVVLLNGMNWRPRPIFQSYAAYTPNLLSANARFFEGPRAPDYLVVKLETIDRRLPTLDDGAALLDILHWYHPVLAERSYVLMKRNDIGTGGQGSGARDNKMTRCQGDKVTADVLSPCHRVTLSPSHPPPDREIVRQAVIHIDQEIVLDRDDELHQVLSLEMQCSRRGKVWGLLHKSPPLYLSLKTDDGQLHYFRLVPEMARTGFLISPLVVTNWDMLQLYAEGVRDQRSGVREQVLTPDPSRLSPFCRRVVSFAVRADAAYWPCFRPDIRMTLARIPNLVSQSMPATELNRLRYPSFQVLPDEVYSSTMVEVVECEGREVLMVHPDGEMRIAIPSGGRHLSAHFGILPRAYQTGTTDGVRFIVEHHPTDGPCQVLFDRYLDPRQNQGDRGLQSLAVALPDGCSGNLLFKTGNLPGKNLEWDWSFWADIQVK
jgi:hypothetical protein